MLRHTSYTLGSRWHNGHSALSVQTKAKFPMLTKIKKENTNGKFKGFCCEQKMSFPH